MLEFELVQGYRLREVLWPLIDISGEATVVCNPESMYLQASDSKHAVIFVLRFHKAFFDHYLVDKAGKAGVGVIALYSILGTADDEDSITVRANCRFERINFTFEDVETHETRSTSADIVRIPPDHIEFDDSNYKFEVVVGIPSKDFRNIFLSLRNFGPGAAMVYIAASKVRFYIPGVEIVLRKENGECIIGGVKEEEEEEEKEEQEICIPVGLKKVRSIIEASLVCGTVWLFYSAHSNTPLMINCPIGLMANFNLYFIDE